MQERWLTTGHADNSLARRGSEDGIEAEYVAMTFSCGVNLLICSFNYTSSSSADSTKVQS
jgi:hypothetical protein